MGSHLSKQSDKSVLEYTTKLSKSDKPLFYRLNDDQLTIKYISIKTKFVGLYYNFNQFLNENKDIIKWKHSECKVAGVRGYHPESRIVFKCQDFLLFTSIVLENFIKENNLVPIGQTDFLMYEELCFSIKHVDRMGAYTCLIFPHGYESTGGELIIYDDGKEIVNFKPYNLKSTTMVIFPSNMVHEVLPVTSGKRYVLKMSLTKDKDDMRKMNNLNHINLD